MKTEDKIWFEDLRSEQLTQSPNKKAGSVILRLIRIIDEQAARLEEWREAGAYLRLKSSGPNHSAGGVKNEVDNLMWKIENIEEQLLKEKELIINYFQSHIDGYETIFDLARTGKYRNE